MIRLNDVGARIVVTLSSFYKRLDSIGANARLRHIVVTNIKECFPPLLRPCKVCQLGHYGFDKLCILPGLCYNQ